MYTKVWTWWKILSWKIEIPKKVNQRQLKPKTLGFFPHDEDQPWKTVPLADFGDVNFILKPEEVTIKTPFWIPVLQGLKVNT